MKTKTFFDISQAESYLRGSIIRYNGIPCMIVGVNRSKENKNSYVVHLEHLGSSHLIENVEITDENIDFNPVPLGFINIEKHDLTYKGLRYPSRQWKVGLCRQTLKVSPLLKGLPSISRDSLINSSSLAKTITGEYPSLATAIDTIKNKQESTCVAFNRRFAIYKDELYHLLHKECVGHYNSKGVIKLRKPYEFLQETLDRALGR